ncbi:WXG100 family type VII secretion target [Nocardia donostiensis]|uniref:ESAT-6-like protein n=1 Tax=Nocardia donostiensis TaxID=1538463 RepID=A0A1V2TM62_9NOCA|nr:WXG100 family type VII secretion target [Nocardia donostiensis]ONM50563.1 WXG100 family type VII secretion target [Nocardia donostiensis]OQS17204.1 WXG100 family type VII secretion target [Nocardia donostiensis]OQS20792.1 WXG100 family type VII secretion target [Nocardia donostiensis]
MSVKYSEGQLIQLAGDIRTSKSRLVESHDELAGYVNQLVATWEGGAQEAYRAKQAKWDSAHNDLLTILENIAKVVEDGAINMSTTDKKNAQAWL